MKKVLILGFCLLGGCAALRGQTKYAGRGTEPTIRERIVRLPEMPKRGMQSGENETKDSEDKPKEATMPNYWDLPADKVATVSNPLDSAINVHVECDASFPSTVDMVVPAHMSQDMLFTTNAQYMYDTLCRIASYTETK